MKKIIFLIMTVLVFTSCLTKVNVDNKGDLNLSIKWPESSDSKSASKIIKTGTTDIVITITNSLNQNEFYTKIVKHNSDIDSTHNVEFNDLSIGNWNLEILCKDSSGASISQYKDIIAITSDNSTLVTTNLGAPQKILEPYENIASGGYIYLGVVYPGSTDLEIISASDSAILTIYISKSENFDNIIYSNEYPSQVNKNSTAFWSINYPGNGLENNTKYYWKVMEQGSGGALQINTTSKTFSFTTD
mgnify:CR=1 FL=1